MRDATAEPAREPLHPWHLRGGRYGKISKIALVWPVNLKGIVNKAFTMSAVSRSCGIFKE
jgi:hypothetical protein